MEETQTSEETPEETQPEPEEAETSEETQEDNQKETSEETVEGEAPKAQEVDYEAKFKESQKEAIKLKKENDSLKKSKKTPTGEPLDVDSILEVQTATKGLDSDEVAELRLRAKALGVDLSEARKDENFVLWQEARKTKVAKAKALNPSTTQTESQKPKTLEQRLNESKTFEEREKILDEVGLNPMRIGSDLNKIEDF